MKVKIGIDPGTKTGVAVSVDRKLTDIISGPIRDCMKYVDQVIEKYGVENIAVFVEDPNLRKWYGSDAVGKAQGAGSVKRDYALWLEYLNEAGVKFEGVHPVKNGTKLKADLFQKITGWKKQTNEHKRDAAMIIFGK